MHLDSKLKKIKPKDTPLLWVGYTLLGMMLLLGQPANADNVILIDQAGDNLNLTIDQAGSGNRVRDLNSTTGDASLNGAYLNLTIDQSGKTNDTGLWTSGTNITLLSEQSGNFNDAFIDSHGNYNTLKIQQFGDYNYGWVEAGTSNSNSSNLLQLYQSGDSHYAYVEAISGQYNDMDIFQGGGQDDGYIRAILNSGSDSNDLTVWQGKHKDGTTDSDEEGDHEAYWTVTGDNNVLASYQTDTNRSNGGAGHHLAHVITGDSNTVVHQQKGKAGHDGFIEIDGDNNTVDLYQRGNGGVKWADIVLDGDGHTVDVNQRGSQSATAAIDLTYGTGAYTLDLNQNVTSQAGSYSITGVCYNAGGCSITINGNN